MCLISHTSRWLEVMRIPCHVTYYFRGETLMSLHTIQAVDPDDIYKRQNSVSKTRVCAYLLVLPLPPLSSW